VRIIKPKLYLAMSVLLSNVPEEHRGANGCRQFTILVRSTSIKRVAYVLDTTVGHLTNFGGIHVDYPHADRISVVPEDEIDQIYYRVEHCVSGARGWFKYKRSESQDKRSPL
jgi:hypothetical protein